MKKPKRFFMCMGVLELREEFKPKDRGLLYAGSNQNAMKNLLKSHILYVSVGPASDPPAESNLNFGN
jgi:hypothetical protein